MSTTFLRNARVEAAPLNDEAILFDPQSSKFFMLNRTSAFIWERLSSPTTAESLATELCAHFDSATPADVAKDVHRALEDMLSMELVIASNATIDRAPG